MLGVTCYIFSVGSNFYFLYSSGDMQDFVTFVSWWSKMWHLVLYCCVNKQMIDDTEIEEKHTESTAGIVLYSLSPSGLCDRCCAFSTAMQDLITLQFTPVGYVRHRIGKLENTMPTGAQVNWAWGNRQHFCRKNCRLLMNMELNQSWENKNKTMSCCNCLIPSRPSVNSMTCVCGKKHKGTLAPSNWGIWQRSLTLSFAKVGQQPCCRYHHFTFNSDLARCINVTLRRKTE